MDPIDLAERCREAHEKIRAHVRHTPMDYSRWLSSLNRSNVYIKWESEQVTGSFKVRGALNKLMVLQENNKLKNGFITASSGNHGAACSRAMNILGITNGTIYIPVTTDSSKLKNIEQYGAKIEMFEENCGGAELKAKADSQDMQMPYISPYNDVDIIAGQGTLGFEIYEDLPTVDVVIVSVGGGGLISGIASYLKSVKPDIKVIGCEAINSCPMAASVKADKIVNVEVRPTLSDGTAGDIEPGTITLKLCQKLVDEWVEVSEKEISNAIYNIIKHHHKIIEGAAGVAVAAYIKIMDKYNEKNVVIVSCGSNISIQKLKDIMKMYND